MELEVAVHRLTSPVRWGWVSAKDDPRRGTTMSKNYATTTFARTRSPNLSG